ncbi:hypothetical protein AB0D49_13830 [Streptomyces sp. NPDC048290]|uniref:hypothetical protein n=1 Tax=Streptomyces sp. NPDC048290 TaxID=3155811 RepID=UPI003413D24C
MVLEAISSAVLGLALAWMAASRLPHRLPARPLVLSTGVAGSLFGAFLTHSALETASLLLVLTGSGIVATASVSLLVRPTGRLRRRSATA